MSTGGLLYDWYNSSYESSLDECISLVAKANKDKCDDQRFSSAYDKLMQSIEIMSNLLTTILHPAEFAKDPPENLTVIQLDNAKKRAVQIQRAYHELSRGIESNTDANLPPLQLPRPLDNRYYGTKANAKHMDSSAPSQSERSRGLRDTQLKGSNNFVGLNEDLDRLDQILYASQAAEVMGSDILVNLEKQKQALSRGKQHVERVKSNVDDSSAVLNRVSNWFNQFR